MDAPLPIPLRTDFTLTRESAFSYACQACSRCCHDKVIPVNPYEVARLAHTLGLTSTEVLERFTTSGGAAITVRDDGTCIFLGEEGCRVHEGRPLACRLYPLGRRVTSDGDEHFAEVVPHSECIGIYGGEGTIDDWLRVQGTAPFLDAAARYTHILRRMVTAFSQTEGAAEIHEETAAAMHRAPVPEDENWLDMDAVLASRCAARGEAVPADIEQKTGMHIAALEEIIARFEG